MGMDGRCRGMERAEWEWMDDVGEWRGLSGNGWTMYGNGEG